MEIRDMEMNGSCLDLLKDGFRLFMEAFMLTIALPIITVCALLTGRMDLLIWGCIVGALVGSYELYDVWIYVLGKRQNRHLKKDYNP
jgi:hypothetical protein